MCHAIPYQDVFITATQALLRQTLGAFKGCVLEQLLKHENLAVHKSLVVNICPSKIHFQSGL